MKTSNSAATLNPDHQGKKEFILRQFAKGLMSGEQATEELDLLENAEYFKKQENNSFFKPVKKLLLKFTGFCKRSRQ